MAPPALPLRIGSWQPPLLTGPEDGSVREWQRACASRSEKVTHIMAVRIFQNNDSRKLKTSSRAPEELPRRIQEPPKRPQELSKTLQESSKYAPGAPKEVLRCFKDTPKPSKELPRPPEEAPKRFKETQQRPKDTQEHRKRAHRRSKYPLRGSRRLSNDVLMLSCSKTLRLRYPHHLMLARYRDPVL